MAFHGHPAKSSFCEIEMRLKNGASMIKTAKQEQPYTGRELCKVPCNHQDLVVALPTDKDFKILAKHDPCTCCKLIAVIASQSVIMW